MMNIKLKYSGALAHPVLDEAQKMCAWLRHFAANLPAETANGERIPCAVPPEQVRALICGLEQHMRAEQESGNSPAFDVQEGMPLKHLFAPGAYGRQITVPKDHWVIGKIHKHAHLNFLMQGRVAVLTEDGLMVMQAPFSFVSRPGAKRLVLALEETVWATVHLTSETDLSRIEDEVIAKDYSEVPQIELQNVKELML
jgi:hypothetical protein